MAGMLTISNDPSAAEGLLSRLKWLEATVLAAETVRGPVLDELRREAPVAKKVIKGVEPGYLRDSIKSDITAGAGVVALRYSTDADYAGWVVDGTGPHEIVPRSATVLHWTDTDTGEEVFRRRVWHPGTQPNDFPGRAADRMIPVIEMAFGSVFERF